MELARFAVVHYGAVALLTVVAYLAGRGLTWRCRFDSALERFTVSTGLGLGLVALLALMLGLLRILTPIAVIGAAAALLAASLAIGRPWRNAPRALLHRGTRSMRRAGFLLVALPAVGLLALLPLYPPTAWDATMYHLATAKLYATRHAVEFSPYIRFQTFPQVNELLYTLMLLVSDDVPAQIVHFGMALLTALVLYVWGRQAWSPAAGLWAAALWLSNPLTLWLAATAYIDLGLTCFVTLAFYCAWKWRLADGADAAGTMTEDRKLADLSNDLPASTVPVGRPALRTSPPSPLSETESGGTAWRSSKRQATGNRPGGQAGAGGRPPDANSGPGSAGRRRNWLARLVPVALRQLESVNQAANQGSQLHSNPKSILPRVATVATHAGASPAWSTIARSAGAGHDGTGGPAPNRHEMAPAARAGGALAVQWLLLAGVFAGLAAGSKYLGLVVVALLGLATVAVAARQRRPLLPVLFGLAALLALAPWYLRNLYYTGNPVFPFLGQIFGYSLWTYDDVWLQTLDLRHLHGTGRSGGALLRLPWRLFSGHPALVMEAPLARAYLLLLPLALPWAIVDRTVRALVALVLLFTLWWFFSAQILRYYLPVLPVVSLLAAAALYRTLARPAVTRRWLTGGAAAALIGALLFAPGAQYAVRQLRAGGPVPLTSAARETYLAARLFPYPAYRLLNEREGDSYRLYALYGEQMVYFAGGTVIGDWFGPGRYSDLLRVWEDSRALYETLRAKGVTHLLVLRDRFPLDPPSDPFFQEHFLPLITDGWTLLFELT